MLRLVYSGTPEPPPPSGRGWLRLAGAVEIGLGLVWLLSLAAGWLRGAPPAPGSSTRIAIALAGYGAALVIAGVGVFLRRRGAWAASLVLGGACLVLGFLSQAPAAILIAIALLATLLAGRPALLAALLVLAPLTALADTTPPTVQLQAGPAPTARWRRVARPALGLSFELPLVEGATAAGGDRDAGSWYADDGLRLGVWWGDGETLATWRSIYPDDGRIAEERAGASKVCGRVAAAITLRFAAVAPGWHEVIRSDGKNRMERFGRPAHTDSARALTLRRTPVLITIEDDDPSAHRAIVERFLASLRCE